MGAKCTAHASPSGPSSLSPDQAMAELRIQNLEPRGHKKFMHINFFVCSPGMFWAVGAKTQIMRINFLCETSAKNGKHINFL